MEYLNYMEYINYVAHRLISIIKPMKLNYGFCPFPFVWALKTLPLSLGLSSILSFSFLL